MASKLNDTQKLVLVQIGISVVWFLREVWNSPQTEKDRLEQKGVELFNGIDSAVKQYGLGDLGD